MLRKWEAASVACYWFWSTVNLRETSQKKMPIIMQHVWYVSKEGNGHSFQYPCLNNSMGHSPWGHKESDTTEWLTHIHTWCIRHFLKTIVYVSLYFRLTSKYHYYLYSINWGIDVWSNFSNTIPSFLDESITLSVGYTWLCIFYCVITMFYLISDRRNNCGQIPFSGEVARYMFL